MGHHANPIINVCLGAAPGHPHFPPLIIPLDKAEALWGKEVVGKIGEEPRLANLSLHFENEEA